MDDTGDHLSGAELEARVAEIWHAFRAMGHPLHEEALDRCRHILSGDVSYEEAIDEISARYTRTVAELTGDLAAGVFTEDDFIQAIVNIPIVRRLDADSGIPARGPIAELNAAFSAGEIGVDLHTRTLAAMIAAGHEA